MNDKIFALKGNLVYTPTSDELKVMADSYLVCEDGKIVRTYQKLPDIYAHIQVIDYGDCIIMPGMTDLHLHAPQYSFRATNMDTELLEWLEHNTFPEEARYADIDYAHKAYSIFVDSLKKSATTCACIFATIHKDATLLLMDMLEEAHIISMVGKVNMNRNCPDSLMENNIDDTIDWIDEVLLRNYKYVSPILTPRFIPSCDDDMMREIKKLQLRYDLPVQSHLSENLSEISWVQKLCPSSKFYADAYDQFGLFGGDYKTIMAHCVYSDDRELDLIYKNKVYIAHCPESNANLSSGIAPIRHFLDKGVYIGLGSDIAGGTSENMFRCISQAIQVSKLRWRLISDEYRPLTVSEAVFMSTKGGGSFFGKTGSL